MSTVVLSLFGDEIIPEQINAVGKSRAARKPKISSKKEEAESEVVEAAQEVKQEEVPAIISTATSEQEVAPVELEVESEQVESIPPILEVAREVGEEIITPIVLVEPEVSVERKEDISPVVKAVLDVKHETVSPIDDIVAVGPEVTLIPVEAIPEPIEVAQDVMQERLLPMVEAIPEKVETAPVVVEDAPEVPKTVQKAAVKNPKPAAKKTTVKKGVVKREKPEGHNILEGWTPDKQYYSIGEVASLFYVATSHIRFWTNEFALKVRTTRKGDRLYSPEQINELRTIYHLVKEKGYTIAGAKARLKEAKKTPVHTLDLKQSLLQLRNKLVDIKNQL